MTTQILLGCLLIVVTTFVHAGGMALSLGALRIAHVEKWAGRSRLTQATTVSGLVLLMFFATLVESAIWAMTYVWVGALPDLEKALYFSSVTYTTLGYGDLVLEESFRQLSGIEAANGTIMFGWTTALIYAAVQRVYFAQRSAGGHSGA